MLRSKKMYDLCVRSLQGLPLPARALTRLLIESILGRLLQTEAVIMCGYVWMSKRPHMQLFCQVPPFFKLIMQSAVAAVPPPRRGGRGREGDS